MLIIGTLVVTWIAKNWWKILLLLVAVIILREYQVHKYQKKDKAAKVSEDNGARAPGSDAPDPAKHIPPPFGREDRAGKNIIDE